MYKYVLNSAVKISLMFDQYFECYAMILMGPFFCGHAVRLLKFLSRKTVRLTLILYTVHCSNENTSDPGLQVKFQNIHNFRTKELLCTLTDLISLDITNRMNFLLIQVYDSYCRGVLVESPAADII